MEHPYIDYADISEESKNNALKNTLDFVWDIALKIAENAEKMRLEADIADAYAINAGFDAHKAALAYAGILFVYNVQVRNNKK